VSIKTVIARQLRENINAVRKKLAGLEPPSEGWLRTMRKALGMSGAQLARRMGMTRGAVSRNEKAEREGAITLKTMKHMAANMNCRFVYAVIPDRDVEEIIEHQAREKARQLVNQAGVHMALEDQSLSKDRLNAEIERIAKELLSKPSSIWDDV
jgi:predicted DNA-binding mobile mystery protein A